VDTIKKHKIELLHVHYAIPHAYAGYMAKQMLKEEGIDLPMVTTLHGTDITLVGSHPFYNSAVTFSITKSVAITLVSENLKKHTIVVLHVHDAIQQTYTEYMAKQMLKEEGIDLPMVTTLHGTDITLVGSHPFYKPAVTFSMNKSDAITSVSENLKEDILRLF